MSEENATKIQFEKVFKDEQDVTRKKRETYHSEDVKGPSFGIALSGGGIRSATINLGVLQVLNDCDILKRADYLSSVSGGSYIAGYVHARLKQNGPDGYTDLFSQEKIDSLRDHGKYLTPGKGWQKLLSILQAGGAVVASLLMNWIWVIAFAGVLFLGLKWFASWPNNLPWYQVLGERMLAGAIIILCWHFFLHGLRHLHFWNSDLLNALEGITLVFLVILGILHVTVAAPPADSALRDWFLLCLAILVVTGFFANPNLLTLHRFYRDRLGGAYLQTAGRGDKSMMLMELLPDANNPAWAPYPLINTCLNLLNWHDPHFKGTMSNDYFLLSPLYCGSKLTGYIETDQHIYRSMTLSTAVAVSGAAVSPHMGTRSNRVAAFFLTLLNLRTSYWALSPNPKIPVLFKYITWWPYYNLLELMSRKDTFKWRVNLSDGGHIENLGVYELLRRGCQLIIGVDATADPKFAFADLKNLVIRARNELGLAITFRQTPETFIRPLASEGFSRSHYVTALITDLPGKRSDEQLYQGQPGLLIYLKSSVRAPKKMRAHEKIQTPKRSENTEGDSFAYKTYHPSFPHESTANQFFDPDQWSAYYQLGRFMAGDLLGVDVSDKKNEGHKNDEGHKCEFTDIKKLYDRFIKIAEPGDLEDLLERWDEEMKKTIGME